MNCPGHAAGPRWCYPEDSGEAAGGDAVDMIADYYSTADDLFKLVWERGGGGAGGAPGLRTTQPAAESCHWSPPPEVRFEPPSEGQMAAWLGTIVRGEELAVDDGGGRDVPAAKKGSSDNASMTTDSKEKLIPVTEGIGTMQEMRKAPASGGSSRTSHNLTEKRRRNKINERFKTLRQLVPGCDKSNQASTLDQTIQYMKSLQQHVQAMSVGPARPAAAAAAVPVVQPRYAPPEAPPVAVQMMPAAPVILAPAPTTMVPFGAMLHQMPHYPAAVPVMMPASASAALLSYPAAPPPRAAAVEPGGAGSSASRRHGSSSRKGKGGRRLRQKH